MERHGPLRLDAPVRERGMSLSAATMDRLLQTIPEPAQQGRRRWAISTPLRKSIAVRTLGDWNDPAPGYFEMDRVAHCGKSTAGSHVHSLDRTDLASGWTETRAMMVREQTLVMETVGEIRTQLPFPMRGLDVDNDSAFSNDTLGGYGRDHTLELPRCRAYKKNDQACDGAEERSGGPAQGGLWEAGGGGVGGGAEQVVRVGAAVGELLPAFLQADLEDAGGRPGDQEVSFASDAL